MNTHETSNVAVLAPSPVRHIDCDCGGEPHGKYCTAVLRGYVRHEEPTQPREIRTVADLRAAFSVMEDEQHQDWLDHQRRILSNASAQPPPDSGAKHHE